MALFNYAAKEVTLKIVYYGPGLKRKDNQSSASSFSARPGKNRQADFISNGNRQDSVF